MKITITVPRAVCSKCETTAFVRPQTLTATQTQLPEFLQQFPDTGLTALDNNGGAWRILQADRPAGWTTSPGNSGNLLSGLCNNCKKGVVQTEPLIPALAPIRTFSKTLSTAPKTPAVEETSKPVQPVNELKTQRTIVDLTPTIMAPAPTSSPAPTTAPNTPNPWIQGQTGTTRSNIHSNVQIKNHVASAIPNARLVGNNNYNNTNVVLTPVRPSITGTILDTKPAAIAVETVAEKVKSNRRRPRTTRGAVSETSASIIAASPTPALTSESPKSGATVRPSQLPASKVTILPNQGPIVNISTPMRRNMATQAPVMSTPNQKTVFAVSAVAPTKLELKASAPNTPSSTLIKTSPFVTTTPVASTTPLAPSSNNSKIVSVVSMEVDENGKPIVPKISSSI